MSWLLPVIACLWVWPGNGGGVGRNELLPGAERIRLEPLESLEVGRSVFESPLVVGGLMVAWSGDGVLRAWELPGLSEVWRRKWRRTPVSCWGEGSWLVVSLGYPGRMVLGLDLPTGSTRWRRKDIDPSCAPLVAGGVALVGTRAGEIVALNLRSGREVWRNHVCSTALSGIAVLDDGIVATDIGGELVCLREGAVLWRRPLGGNCYGGPAVSEGIVVCTSFTGQVAAFDKAGRALWHHSTGDRFRCRACVGRGLAVVVAGEGTARAFRLSDGTAVWQHTLDGVLQAPPTLVGTTILVGSLQGRGWLIDLESGAVCDSLEVKGGFRSQAAVGSGLVAWCSGDGRANVWRIRPSSDSTAQ